ncbi:MAG: sensor histidine kinase [Magnetovibrionaceae bacterium]
MLIVVLVVGLLVVERIFDQQFHVDSTEEKNAFYRAIATDLLFDDLYFLNVPEIRSAMDFLTKIEDVSFVAVFDANKNPIAQTSSVDTVEAIEPSADRDESARLVIETDRLRVFDIPILVPGSDIVGYVRIGFSNSDTAAAHAEHQIRILWLGGLGMLMGGLLAWWVTVRLSRPIEGLALAAADMRKNPSGGFPDVKTGTKEIEYLADSMKSLFDEQSARQQDLEQEIAARKETEAALRRATELAEASNAAKATFLATMSHELRTPLNAILGFSDILKNETMGPLGQDCYREYAGIVHKSGSHLLSLIDDILDMSRIEAGRFTLHREPLDTREMIEEVVEMIGVKADASRIAVKITAPDGLPVFSADRRAVKQILFNLLGNAIKFSPADTEINIKADLVEADIVFTMADQGRGIAAEDLERVLEPFTRTSDADKNSDPGSGLGLAITKRLVELHGGSLSIDSTLGEGTTVMVRLPIN